MPKKKSIEQKKREKEKTRKNDESKNCERLNIDSSGTLEVNKINEKPSDFSEEQPVGIEHGHISRKRKRDTISSPVPSKSTQS